MVVNDTSFDSVFFDENEILDRSAREEKLFKNFGQRLKKITDMSLGWNKILKGIDFSKIRKERFRITSNN